MNKMSLLSGHLMSGGGNRRRTRTHKRGVERLGIQPNGRDPRTAPKGRRDASGVRTPRTIKMTGGGGGGGARGGGGGAEDEQPLPFFQSGHHVGFA